MKKKILIACPTSYHKDYCLEEWANKIIKICEVAKNDYDIGIRIVDNTYFEHNAKHFWHIKSTFDKKNISNIPILVSGYSKQNISLRELMSECNNIISDIVLKNNFDYLLSIESDIFPPNNVIEKLLKHNPNSKKVVALPYFLYNSFNSKSIMFDMEDFGDHRLCVPVDTDRIFALTDGKLHEAQQLGLGCAMIHRSILKQIPFRVDKDDKTGSHPDSFFYEDCRAKSIKLYFDTSAYCIHKNGSWKNINYM